MKNILVSKRLTIRLEEWHDKFDRLGFSPVPFRPSVPV